MAVVIDSRFSNSKVPCADTVQKTTQFWIRALILSPV